MANGAIVPITESLSKSLDRLFKTGGFALAFGFGGLFLILVANLLGGPLTIPIFVAGCVLTFSCLLFFVISNLRTRQVAKRIKDDLPLLDSLQRVTLQMTDFASLMQSFAFKHISKIHAAIETIMPLVEKIPFVGQAAKDAGLADTAKLSGVIVGATENVKEIVRKLDDAIRSGDLQAINSYSANLKTALQGLRAALATEEAG